MRLLKNLCFLSLLALAIGGCKDACDDVDCGANGTCVDGTCVCDNGWSGTNCSTSICDTVDCGPNGSCDPATGDCNCNEGYSGANCEINVCDGIDCGNGNCDTATGECICDEGYEGTNCDVETRSQYYGVFQGDMTPCIPAFVALLIPDDELETLQVTELEVSASTVGIQHLWVSSTSDVLGIGLDYDIREPNFIIPEFSQDVDIAGNSVSITGGGTGMFDDPNQLQLTLDIVFNASGIDLNSNCMPVFTKI